MKTIIASSHLSAVNGKMRNLRNVFAMALLCSLANGNVSAQDNSAWMSGVADNTFVSQLSIPGVHDAGTGHGFTTLHSIPGEEFARTQDKTLTEMWNSGIRAFDLRPSVDGSDLRICHGYINTNLMFSTAISTLCNLLDQHPTETAIVIIRHESEGDSGSGNWNNLIKSKLSSSPASSHTVNFVPNIKMKEARGKLIVLSRDEYDTNPIGGFISGWGSSANFSQQQGGHIRGIGNNCSVFIQDFYDVSASGATATKTASIQRMLQFSCSENKDAKRWVINHTSGYTKTFLGIVTSDGYRDNAKNQNPVVINYLNSHTGSTGLVLMDYGGVDNSDGYNTKGQALTNALINNNFREGPNDPYFRALPTVTLNKNYSVFTEVNGTKYYLTTSGTLTSNRSDAGVFTLKAGNSNGGEYGDSFFFEWTSGSTVYHFTNPNQNTGGNGTFASNNSLVPVSGDSYNRIWESQILLLGSNGKYAIRATNAPATGNNWNLYAANTYWSVKNSNSNPPTAGYVFGTPDYRWQFTVITDPAQLSNNKLYTIKTSRGYLTLNNAQNQLVSSHKNNGGTVNPDAATDNASRQFGILKIDGLWYIYSPKIQKFARYDCENIKFYADRGTALTFTYDGIDNAEGSNLRLRIPYMGSRGEASYLKPQFINNNNGGGIVLRNYITPDAGNTFIIEEVDGATLNYNEAMNVFNGPSAFFDTSKLYRIASDRVSQLAVDDVNAGTPYIVGTKSGVTNCQPNASSAQKNFVFVKNNGKYRIYHPASGKYVAKLGLSDSGNQIVKLVSSQSEAASIDFLKINNSSYPYVFYVVDTGCLWNSQGTGSIPGKVLLSLWNSAYDQGNCYKLETAGNWNGVKEAVDLFGDDEDGISTVEGGKQGAEVWYDLNGRKLSGGPTQKGVYINNGKKVAVR